MLRTNLKLSLAAALLAGSGVWAQADDLKPFPLPEAGMQRFVIRVPAVPVPEDHKVEVVVGKTLEADCNRQIFGAKVTRKVAQGWGFPYYIVSELKGPVSTMMACPPGTPKHEEFVRANAPELAGLRYNPKLPIVVYAPDGTEVRFRVWSAGSTLEKATAE